MYNTCVDQLYDIGLDYHHLKVSIRDQIWINTTLFSHTCMNFRDVVDMTRLNYTFKRQGSDRVKPFCNSNLDFDIVTLECDFQVQAVLG